jgi:ATP-dependent DNA helicase RecQ
MFDLLQELASDAENGTWQDLNLPALTAALKTATGKRADPSLRVASIA